MLRVLKAGIYTSIQNKGRFGYANMGVPVSGVMDEYSANIANGILDNSLENSVLEITYGGTVLQFLTPTCICISGANFSPKINGEKVVLHHRVTIKENDILSFGKIKYGVRCYLAVKNGFSSDKKFGSQSFFENITKKKIIHANDILYYPPFTKKLKETFSALKISKKHFKTRKLSCNVGPEFDLLDKHQKEFLLNTKFTISNENNRMGYRLNESILNNLPSILTSAVLPGTVQLTPSGKLIILMKDCQVTGGYPRILQLTKMAITILSQKKQNDELSFKLLLDTNLEYRKN